MQARYPYTLENVELQLSAQMRVAENKQVNAVGFAGGEGMLQKSRKTMGCDLQRLS